MKVCKKFSSIERLLQTKLTNRKYLKNDYLMNVFNKKSLLIKWEIAKNFHRSKNFCKRSWHVERFLQTKFINKSRIANRKFFAKKLLINEIIKTNIRTMNDETIDKNCWSRWRKVDRQTNKRSFFSKNKQKRFLQIVKHKQKLIKIEKLWWCHHYNQWCNDEIDDDKCCYQNVKCNVKKKMFH